MQGAESRPPFCLPSCLWLTKTLSPLPPKGKRGWAPVIILSTTALGHESRFAGDKAVTQGAEHAPGSHVFVFCTTASCTRHFPTAKGHPLGSPPPFTSTKDFGASTYFLRYIYNIFYIILIESIAKVLILDILIFFLAIINHKVFSNAVRWNRASELC